MNKTNHSLEGPEMKQTSIYYYSGTGNSLWTARYLAQQLGDTELISITAPIENRPMNPPKTVGLVFPVHIWGVPTRMIRFLDDLAAMSPDYIFAIATNGGQVSNTLVQLQQLLQQRGLKLSAGWSIVLPSNYIPWGGPGSQAKQEKYFRNAKKRLPGIAEKIKQKAVFPVEKGPLWQRVVFTKIYNLSLPQIYKMDKGFWTDDRCNQCGLCVQLCPSQNVELQEGKLVWHHQCEQCFACLQWCPQEALQYGKKTPKYDRYQHPEIKVKDLLR